MIPFHRPFALSWDEHGLIHDRISNCLESGQLTNGENVRLLEGKIKEMYNVEYCIATSSATMGLMLCLEYCKDDIVKLPAFNWWSDKYALDFIKKTHMYVDIDKETWLPKSACNLYLNTFGNVGECEYEDTIYDSTHCLGAKITDIGLAHVFSLAPTKLVTSCEGGLIITNNSEFAEWARERRDKMCRMSEVHAIIGLQYLAHLPEILEWKRDVYHYYNAHLPGQFQVIPNNSTYNTIAFINTEGLQIPEHITTRQYYEPLKKGLVNTDFVYSKIICLPSFYNVDYKGIVGAIKEVNGL